jgi:type IV pilus assembly protein PilN
MIRINLLPHREEKRKLRQKQFGIAAGISFAVAAALAAIIYLVIDQAIQIQKARNKYLSDEIAKLEKQIDEIKKIREETQALLSKKQVVESLQSNRSEPVQLLDQLLRQLPEGLYIKSVKQVGTKVNVVGYAQSNARVSAFMRNIMASPYLENPILVEIKAVEVNKARANEFSMDFFIKRVQPVESKGAPAKAAPPAAGGKA